MLFRYLVNSDTVWRYGWEEKKELEKVMLDYVRWAFRLDFCTPRYLIMREIGLKKQKIRWGIRAKRFEEKVKELENENSWVKVLERKRKKGLERSI